MNACHPLSSVQPPGSALLGVASLRADWPHWRGPNASGVAPDRTLPLRWSATENIAWKAKIAGAGVSTPIVSGDRVYVTSQIGAGIRREGNHPEARGYRSGPYMALKPGGRGDVNATQVVWRVATGAPDVSSLLYYEGIVYMANDVGVLTAVDAATGARVWQERVDGAFSASPVAGAGHVYFVSENGDTVVLKAGRAPQVIARNALGERAVASPAISNGQMFIRTDTHVFSIGR